MANSAATTVAPPANGSWLPIEGFVPDQSEGQSSATAIGRSTGIDGAGPSEATQSAQRLLPKLLPVAASALCLYVLLSSVLGTYERSLELSSRHPIVYWLYVVVASAAWLSVGILLVVVVERFRRLPDVSKLQRMCRDVAHEEFMDDHEAFRGTVESYLHTLQNRNTNNQVQAALSNALAKFTQYSHSPPRDLRHLTEVFHHLHEQADQRIRSAARQTALGTALANRHLDLLIVTAQMLRLTDQLAALYVGKPDRIQVLRLAGRAASHLLGTNVTGLFTEAVTQSALNNSILKLVGARAAEGAVNGMLMLRFGEAVKAACCPVAPPPLTVDDYLQRMRNLIWERATDTPPV